MNQHQYNKQLRHIEELVRAACHSPNNAFGPGMWEHHIRWVVKFGRMLSSDAGANPLVVELSALLHDYASVKSFALYSNHHIHGALEAKRLLSDRGFSASAVEAVCHCIETHRGSMRLERRTIEAVCLADADAMAHFVGVPSLLDYAVKGKGYGVEEASAWVRAKLERSWNKLSPLGRQHGRSYYTLALELLSDRTRVEALICSAFPKYYGRELRGMQDTQAAEGVLKAQ